MSLNSNLIILAEKFLTMHLIIVPNYSNYTVYKNNKILKLSSY